MATIVYLDVDDEITSAAARVRAAGERQVALVIPYGSRLATSRINFRLLAREAQARGRDLAIVAGDAATRALAASAGLPAHASVADYETAAAGGAPAHAPDGTLTAAAPPPSGTSPTAAAEATRPSRRRKSQPPPSGPPPAGPAADLEATIVAPQRSESERASRADVTEPPPAPSSPPPDAGLRRPGSIRVVGPRRGFSRPAMLVGAALLVALIVVGGVGAYVFLPSATIRVTPRVDPVVPVSFEVRADPAVAEPDAAAGVVPAERLAIPLGVTGTFPATGVRVEETKAAGVVRFTSENTFVPVTIPAGTRVATQAGTAFSTREAVTVERASFVTGPTSATVAIDAQAAGPGGNVAAGTITELSDDIRQFLISVTNPEATSGGTRTEFPRVERADVDAALADLGTELAAQFEARLADPATTPPGTTLFPATRALGESTPSVDPATLVGQEAASFDLGLTAEGAVTAVDDSPLESLASTRIRAAVDPDHLLVEDSIVIDIGVPTVDGETVLFPVSVEAVQVLVLDAADLLAEVKGRPIHQARTILERYGRVDIVLWPEWVTAIPTLDARLSLVVDDSGSVPTASPRPSPSPTAPASGSPSGDASGAPESVAP
jgi:hypothetical protein